MLTLSSSLFFFLLLLLLLLLRPRQDNNGFIDKNELRDLLSDLFPHFHRDMLERYVNDEFRAADKDFSNCK